MPDQSRGAMVSGTVPGTAHDIAAAVCFVVEEEACFTTGQVLCVAGDPQC